MIRLLIVDDEPLVAIGLQSFLKWEEHGFEVVGTARNGEIAAEMIDDLHPDIVISDIKMPVKSGLSLVAECHAKYGRIPLFIMLTSYEEFDYVRQAIHHQVVDYLIKLELSPDVLLKSLNKAVEILNTLRPTVEAPPNRGNMESQQEYHIHTLLNGIFDREILLPLLKKAHINTTAAAYTAVCFRIIINDSLELGEDKINSLCESTLRMVCEQIERLYVCYVAELDMQHFCLVICLNDKGSDLNRLQDLLGETMLSLNKYFNVTLNTATGIAVNDIFSIQESFQNASGQMHNKNQTINAIQSYIHKNLEKKLTLSEVAAEFNISSGYLSQSFSKHTGENFVEYISKLRVEKAKEMMHGGDALIYEIADRLGFENAFYFSKVFKKYEGISPREYINQLNKLKSG